MKPAVASICASLITLLVVPAAAQVQSKGTVAEERLIARCVHQSARGKRWLESTLLGIRDQEGGWIGAEVQNRDGSYDLGPMQINSWWVSRMARLIGRRSDEVRHQLRYDACFNVEAARWLLLTELARSADVWVAIGRYHSPTPWRQRNYIGALVGRINRVSVTISAQQKACRECRKGKLSTNFAVLINSRDLATHHIPVR